MGKQDVTESSANVYFLLFTYRLLPSRQGQPQTNKMASFLASRTSAASRSAFHARSFATTARILNNTPRPPPPIDDSTSALDYKRSHRVRPPPLPVMDLPRQRTAEEAVTNILYNTPPPSLQPFKKCVAIAHNTMSHTEIESVGYLKACPELSCAKRAGCAIPRFWYPRRTWLQYRLPRRVPYRNPRPQSDVHRPQRSGRCD